MKESHKGRANDKVKVKWLVLVKIYGNKPKKLLNKINENKEIKINVLPLKELGPNKVLNSECNVKVIFVQIKCKREGINQ